MTIAIENVDGHRMTVIKISATEWRAHCNHDTSTGISLDWIGTIHYGTHPFESLLYDFRQHLPRDLHLYINAVVVQRLMDQPRLNSAAIPAEFADIRTPVTGQTARIETTNFVITDDGLFINGVHMPATYFKYEKSVDAYPKLEVHFSPQFGQVTVDVNIAEKLNAEEIEKLNQALKLQMGGVGDSDSK